MSDIEVLPEEVNITRYGGDTVTIHITIDSAAVAGRQWNGQVRRTPLSQKIDATFSIIEDATGATATLLAADSARLVERGDYTGYWDVQLSSAGSDPVTTLARGQLMLVTDVTREFG